jgi:ABC-type dipeptide/oligopeptide/nickel transport system permease subunit
VYRPEHRAWASYWPKAKTTLMPGGFRLFTFVVLVVTLMLLTFMGDALRDALDPRKAHVMRLPLLQVRDLRIGFQKAKTL